MKKTILNKPSKILTSNEIIYKFLDNDLERFLKRWYRYHHYDLVHSKLLPKWSKENSELFQRIMRESRYKYPGYISSVCNILRLMVDHYNFYLDFEDYQICEQIENVLGDKMDRFRNDRDAEKRRKGLSPKLPTEKEARKELKAQGFIDINDFENYDKELSHVMSRKGMRGPTLVFPENFMHSANNYREYRYSFMVPHIHNVSKMIGVKGFSRISTPGNR